MAKIPLKSNKNAELAQIIVSYSAFFFGDPNGFPPLVKGKANAVCEGFAVRGLASEPKGSAVP